MKIALVTGASSGMGREFVKQISQKYPKLDEIWVIARRIDRLSELQKEVKTPLKIIGLDLTKDESLNEFESILAEYKPDVKILVNSAGYGKIGNVEELAYEDVTGMIDLNCRALTAVTYLVLPYISNRSRIIQLASSAAFMPQPGFAIYAATKSYVLSFSKALGYELKKRNITVTSVCPGPDKTEFFDIAETEHSIPFYKKVVMADPKKVVAHAIKEAAFGKEVSVYGKLMQAFKTSSKFLPQKMVCNIISKGR